MQTVIVNFRKIFDKFREILNKFPKLRTQLRC